MARFRLRKDSVAVSAPPSTNRLSWFKADALGLTNGASVVTWADQDAHANLTKIGGATVTYSTTSGPSSNPCVVFNETGGLNGTLGADPGSLLSGLYVIYNNFPTGPQVFKNDGFFAQQLATFPGAWQIGGATGGIAGGDNTISAWRIVLLVWNGASTAVYQNGGAAAGTGTMTGTHGTGANVGGALGGGSWNGNIAEVIWYTTATLSTLNTAASYLSTKYGLTWTTAV